MSGQGKHFPIHLDEARSVGLAKACVPLKNLFCSREKQFITMKYVSHAIHTMGVIGVKQDTTCIKCHTPFGFQV